MSIFPSFKFKSTTWDLVQYHFRSIDTWLDGVCRSHCPEHPWDSASLAIAAAAGKRSIFSDQLADQEDCDADMPDLGPSTDEPNLNPTSNAGCVSECCQLGDEDEDDSCSGGGDGEELPGEESLPSPPTPLAAEKSSALLVAGTAAAVPKPPAKGKRISSSLQAGTSTKVAGRNNAENKDARVYYVGQSNGYNNKPTTLALK